MHIKFNQFITLLILGLMLPLCVGAETPRCYAKLESSFFNPYYLTQALSLNRNIFQSSWSTINQTVQIKAQRVPQMVRDRAERMNPNPFGNPYHPKEAGELLEQVLINVLAESLALFGITNPHDVKVVFDFVLEQQRAEWIVCFGEKTQQKVHK